MNLIELCSKLPVTNLTDLALPRYLLGAFRRKSITFANGLTDEKTIVYWFQSKSFTLDLRLKNASTTPILERQGWVGETCWNQEQQLLSWQLSSNYQNHIQWPEPAKLHPIGNAILEFSPSNAYVEDWRQQVSRGLYLGLRLFKIENLEIKQSYAADGGLIICDHFLAFAQSRHPEIQARLNTYDTLADAFSKQNMSAQEIQDYEVSISFDRENIDLSTVTDSVGATIDLENFELLNAETLVQSKVIQGENCRLYFKLDVFQPDFEFSTHTETTTASRHWLQQEQDHLFHATKITL
ncbi:hypothetical protein [Acinetobacter sp. MB5]|uniref:hypothetical protein n=1 Tax=Acinetobacter sp. MB5 TaxID=2069438 RepID=UPI000DD05692|nr:hypothetical protein [Acinetobacter sp. MB5]